MAKAKKKAKTGIKKATKARAKSKKSGAVTTKPGGFQFPTIEDFRREIDRAFEDFGRGVLTSPARRMGESLASLFPQASELARMPAIDVNETAKAFEVTAELPGMTEDDVKVDLTDSILTISGEKKEEKEEKKKGYQYSERRYGSFERTLPVPNGVDTAKVAADFKNGVLTVTLPKKAGGKGGKRKVGVQAK